MVERHISFYGKAAGAHATSVRGSANVTVLPQPR
jgi:hypothetical protein